MGMTIDTAINVLGMVEAHGVCIEAKDIAVETMRKYQQLQADYETRLKADMVAMLTELKKEIEELDVSDVVPEYQDGAEETKEHIANMIEEKINSLTEA